ncbi:hypothetical protein BKA80DRAFT_141240 [Phyllosticta citrichinensis]
MLVELSDRCTDAACRYARTRGSGESVRDGSLLRTAHALAEEYVGARIEQGESQARPVVCHNRKERGRRIRPSTVTSAEKESKENLKAASQRRILPPFLDDSQHSPREQSSTHTSNGGGARRIGPKARPWGLCWGPGETPHAVSLAAVCPGERRRETEKPTDKTETGKGEKTTRSSTKQEKASTDRKQPHETSHHDAVK